ncbi:ATP-binding protein [Zoogloea sp.]|uniref:hybrid sensor histidine kinase/response regulator n=1 Tax=Zoogloea sp. TaxID=49181 RepID=UPI0035B2FCD9
MFVDSPLLRRYRKSFIAVVLFIAYAVGLFVHNLNVQQRLERNLLDAARLELAKQAESLSAYFSERHNTLANQAASDPVANYFAGLDLGMTIEYGLGVHTQAIEDRFTQLIDRERLGDTRIYERIVLIGTDGQTIAEAGELSANPLEDYAGLAPRLGRTRNVSLLPARDLLRFSQPILIKNTLRGHLIAYSPVTAIQSRAAAHSLRPEALIASANGRPVGPNAPTGFARTDIARLLADPAVSEARLAGPLDAVRDDTPIALVKQPVDGTPVALAALVTERELSAHAIPSLFLAAAGAVPFIVLYIVMLEMRERRQVEHALADARAAARAEAERLARTRSEFIANMSHEIRTPLNAVLGLAQIGQRDLNGRQARRQFVRILESGEHLLGIVNDILDYTKIEAGKLTVEHIVVEPGQIIDNAITLTAERAYARGLALEVHERGLPSRCLGDPLRLSQILVNLLGNAIKFTERGCVTLEAGVDGDQLHLRVSDTGVGMSPAEIARLFQPFEQADSSTTRRFGGTGLGLSICAHLVELMGGTIEVDSAPGAGSRFDIRLPLDGAEFPGVPPDAGTIVMAGFPPVEIAPLIADLAGRGLPVTRIARPAPPPPGTRLVVVDARLGGDACAWRAWFETLQHQHIPTALAGRLDEIADAPLPEAITAQLHLIERPLRSRHLVACLGQPHATAHCADTPHEARLSGLRILAIDDNEINRVVLEDMLTQEGARVECCEAAADALTRLDAHGRAGFDIVLTDIQMPGMDGYQLARLIVARHPDLPVFGLTAHAGPEARAQCLAAGMLAHITKPVDLDLLVAEILRRCRPAPGPGGAPASAPPPAARPALPAPDVVTEAGEALIDWPAFAAQFRGKPRFLERIAGKAIVGYRDDAARLRALAADGNLADLAFLAHSIKGSAGAIKAMPIHQFAAATDLAAREGRPDSLDLALRLAERLERLADEIEARSAMHAPPAAPCPDVQQA